MPVVLEPAVRAERRVWALWIPGVPRPQSRPRQGRGGHFYSDTPRVREWKKTVLDHMGRVTPKEPITGAIDATMHFHMPRPKRLGEGGQEPHLGVPDGDNLAKAIMDCAQRASVIANDSHVWSWRIRKIYAASGEEPGAFIWLRTHE